MPKRKTDSEMIGLVKDLLQLAGENGNPLLETGLLLILRASNLTQQQKADLAAAGMLILGCIPQAERR